VWFFLGKTWYLWLLAALLAALIAWLLCRWWARRRGSAVDGAASHELGATQSLLHTREAELQRLATERTGHVQELAALRPKAAAHDELNAQLAGLRAGSVPLAEHQARVDQLNTQVSTLTGRVAELEGPAGRSPGLQARIGDLESQLAQRDSAKPDVTGAAHVLGFPVAVDDLTLVEGIGPKIAELCHDAGIRTWRQLSQTPVSRLQAILDAAGPRYQIHHPGTWPKQAALLADGHWEPFKSWTDQLKGGRTAE
jgi:predicted flap endonuclease-1-like 5' DNA nuclease